MLSLQKNVKKIKKIPKTNSLSEVALYVVYILPVQISLFYGSQASFRGVYCLAIQPFDTL